MYAYSCGETSTSEQVYRLVKKINSIAFVIKLPTSCRCIIRLDFGIFEIYDKILLL